MPEGPEVHREADKIKDAIAGKDPIYVFFHHEHLKQFEKELTGMRVENVEAHGKGLVITFQNDSHIFSHNQLYGKWYIKPAGSYPDTNRQLRLEIRTDQKSALLYSASDIDVLDGESLSEHPYLTKLGPDLLKSPGVEEVADRTVSKAFHRKSFASLLLDQSFLSGVGNYLRTEILFDSGIHPSLKPKDLSNKQVEEFSKSAIIITQRAYETGGVTVDEQLLHQLKRNGEKRRTYRHYLFARAGKACRICGSEIKKERMSGRRIYICESCQAISKK